MSDLRLLVRCHDRLLALPADRIERVLLDEEVNPPRPPAELGVYPHPPMACLGVLQTGGSTWAAWDLGLLLGLPPVRAAWVLLHVRLERGTIRLALRSDRCLNVGPLPAGALHALPAGLLRDRAGALPAAFPAEQVRLRQRLETPVGLDVDLERLLSDEELHFAQEMIQRAAPPDGARHVSA